MNEEQDQNNDIRPLIFLLMAGVAAYALIFIVLVLGVILTVLLTAGAGYLGYKAAVDSQLWESRRIAKDKKLEVARRMELDYFQSQDKPWMAQVANNYYDDKQRNLYDESNRLETALQTVRKIKDVLK